MLIAEIIFFFHIFQQTSLKLFIKFTTMKHSLSLFLLLASLCLLLNAQSQPAPQKDLSYINLPQGFFIQVYAKVPNARSIVRSSQGTIFVSSRAAGKVYALKDIDGDHKADQVIVLAQELIQPNGIAVKDGNLFIADKTRLLRIDNVENNLVNPKLVIVKDDFPNDTVHGWKFIGFGPDNKLYIPIDTKCDTCQRQDPFTTITRMNEDGSEMEIFARGIRNTIGFDWDPKTGYLWFTDNGKNQLGDQLPPDELNLADRSGLNFGYPYCHAGDINDPDLPKKDCSQFEPPSFKFQAHSAPLGVNFYTGTSFPEKYRGGIFVALHGSRVRQDKKVGYALKYLKIDGHKVIHEQTFAQGWLSGQEVKGRPVDTEQLEDGSLLVTDDNQGLVYRIYYKEDDKEKENIAAIAKNLRYYPLVSYQIKKRN